MTATITTPPAEVNVNPLKNVPAVKVPDVTIQFVNVTPQLAADWLKRNRRNRKMKESTVGAYALDIKNDAWMLTHQGIAFDANGNLTDGQHRLMAIIGSKKPVVLLVSAGWPVGDKRKTMDAVDRGTARSLADQLSLQHGIKDARDVVWMANQIAAACMGGARVRKSTTDSVLAVVAVYREEIKWLMENPVKTPGLRTAVVFGCMALGRAVWPEKTKEFFSRAVTGENLNRDNPALHIRNWLLGNRRVDATELRQALFHHLHAFAEGRPLSSLVTNSNASFIHALRLQRDRVEKVCAIYGQPVPEALQAKRSGDSPASGKQTMPLNAAGIAIGGTLSKRFTALDLSARLEKADNVGQWLLVWRQRGWIQAVGLNEFEKTEKFGKL